MLWGVAFFVLFLKLHGGLGSIWTESVIGQSRWTGVYMDRVRDRSIKVDWGLYGQSP